MKLPAQDPIVVAPTPIPLKSDDSIDHDKLGNNIEKWLNTDLDGFVVVTYGGEENHFGEKDKLTAVSTVVQAHQGKKFVIAGIDSPSPTETIRLSHKYAEAGADMVRIRIPAGMGGYDKSAVSETLEDYYETVTEGSPVPVVIIHQPRSHDKSVTDLSHEQIGSITSMNNVFAYIMSLNYRFECRTPSFIAPGVKFFTCNGTLTLPGAMLGATGACMFFANWAPHLIKKIIALTMNGQIEEAQKIQGSIYHADYLGMSWGVATLKAGLNMLGFDATVPRRPVLPLSVERKERLKEAFVECGLVLPTN